VTWIEEARTARGLTRSELAEICRISETLVYILEEWTAAVTHPKLASRIALALGATAEQRDAIVNEIHRGKWTPKADSGWAKRMEKYLAAKAALRRAEADADARARAYDFTHPHGSPRRRPIVAVNRQGREVARYDCIAICSEKEGLSDPSIRQRCNRKMLGGEFVRDRAATYRWADEWDKMTEAQRAADVRAGDRHYQRHRVMQGVGRAVVYLTKDGTEITRFDSIKMAGKLTGWALSKINRRAHRKLEHEFRFIDTTFRYADEWDRMTPEQRLADLTGR
jgi:ribosome-binding protein aMBF1 (putative translation factor)